MVVILTLITFGIYGIIWNWQTRNEMVEKGADIMHPILMFIPIVNIVFMWQFCGGVEFVTKGKLSQVVAFLLVFLTGLIGMAIIQDTFNKMPPLASGSVSSGDPFAG